MRVLLADSNHDVLQQDLNLAGFSCDPFWDRSAEELKAILPQYELLVLRSKFTVDKALLEKCPILKGIARVGAGMENIDVEFARSRGIRCLSVPEGNRDAVGEHALGMLLMLLNHLKKADAEVRKGIWIRAGNRGTEIMGKTIGIIGFGNTGQAFARKLSGFDCEILAYDKYLTQYGTAYACEANPGEIFERADIVSLHLPLTKETRHYANQDFFNSFSKPIYFINTARGPCTSTEHLAEALRSGKVKGACLDVFEEEDTSFDAKPGDLSVPFRYLSTCENVLLSPHIAGWTKESNYKMSKLIAEKIIKTFPLNC